MDFVAGVGFRFLGCGFRLLAGPPVFGKEYLYTSTKCESTKSSHVLCEFECAKLPCENV